MRPMSKGVCETMTEQQEPEHCGHEKVCILFRTGSIVACNDGTPCMRNSGGCKTCECDTRQHNKIPPAYEAMLAESLTEDQTRTLLMWLVRNKKEMFSQIVCPACKEDVAEKAAAEARKDEQRKWRDEHPGDLVWMTPEEEEARIRRDEREKVLKEIMGYVRKSKYFGKHFMLIMCESLRSGVKKP